MSTKLYKYLFYINLGIIIIAFLYAIIGSFLSDDITTLCLILYLTFLLLSWTFCIIFFFINIYGFFTKKFNRKVHLLLIILLAIWIGFGIDFYFNGILP
jgi:hypothetical protein